MEVAKKTYRESDPRFFYQPRAQPPTWQSPDTALRLPRSLCSLAMTDMEIVMLSGGAKLR
jgi:hypothetical protein